ncbi:MAG: dipeptidyl aminopeptidase/acylaminoacyl peptidase [Myxococcota bacterium]|jgi:dipeptidyl aminopeptidase/acylaminoacyl peptidase
MVDLIPREVLFGNPDRAVARISPDGERISFLAPDEGVLNVWVGPADAVDDARPLTQDRGRGIQQYAWMPGGDRLLYIQDKDGDENWHVFCVELATGVVTNLTPIEGVASQIAGTSKRHPSVVILGLNDRNPQLHDLHRVDLATGERTLLIENPGVAGFVLDDDLKVRFALSPSQEGGWNVLRLEGDDWVPDNVIPQEDALTTQIIGFDKSGRVAISVDSRGRNTAALLATNLDSGDVTVLAEDAQADISAVLQHPTERHIQAAVSTYDRRRFHVLDPALQVDLDWLSERISGDVDVVSRSADDSRWIVAEISDVNAVRYYLYDRTTAHLGFLFDSRPRLADLPLSPMRSVVLTARDGLSLVSYLTLPGGADAAERPDEPLPMVLMVHGGPWARDNWGFDPMHQWLSNRGYAVLAVNFRSSTGFGKRFIAAGDGEWAGAMHNDLLDAVDWAVEQGIADRSRVAIMGGSYGGYATLAGLAFTPEVFACGVDIVGPSNLLTLIESIPPYWKPMRKQLTTRVGDPDTKEGHASLVAKSPLTKAADITKPLLIGQGANDPRVKQAESDQIVAAMRENGIPVEYALFPDEGHGFARPQNRLAFYALTETFFAEHLGGRSEGTGTAFDGSSLILVD